MFLTTRGLILRETHYRESDKILTVLTEDEGKLTVGARGVLRPRSRLASAVQLLSFSEMTLFENKGRWTVNEASTVEEFRGLRADIELLALGSYVAELLEAVSDEDCPNLSVLQLGLNTLFALSNELYPPEQVKAAFELRLMCLAGYRPELGACAVCGRTDISDGYLDADLGGLVCADCRRSGSMRLGAAAIDAMRYIVDAPARRVFSFTLDGDALAQLASVCETYTLLTLDRPFGSLDYYRRIRKKI